MTGTSEDDIDGLILSFAREQWRKVAMVIAEVLCVCHRSGVDISDHMIANCISALAESGKLQAQGKLSMWRHSEVKLPD